MAQSIKIINKNNQEEQVDLLSYFSYNGNNYIIYTKNEQNSSGTILSVGREGNNFEVDQSNPEHKMSQDEWNQIKSLMGSIIQGNQSNIAYKPYDNTKSFSLANDIALANEFVPKIYEVYSASPEVVTFNSTNSNKDLLTSTFGQKEEQPVPETLSTNNNPSGLISPIPAGRTDIESTPVNLGMETTPSQDIPQITPIGVEQTQIGNSQALGNDISIPGGDLSISSLNELKSDIEKVGSEVENNIAQNVSETSNANNELKDFGASPTGGNIFDQMPINNPTLETTLQTPETVVSSIEPSNNENEESVNDSDELANVIKNYSIKLKEMSEMAEKIAVLVEKRDTKKEEKTEEQVNVVVPDSQSGATLMNSDGSVNETAFDGIPSVQLEEPQLMKVA